jgi:hypothetical protein
VELRVDPVAAERYEQLAGLTARERRIMRVRWRKDRERQLQVQQGQLRPEGGQQVRRGCRCGLPHGCARRWYPLCTSCAQPAITVHHANMIAPSRSTYVCPSPFAAAG